MGPRTQGRAGGEASDLLPGNIDLHDLNAVRALCCSELVSFFLFWARVNVDQLAAVAAPCNLSVAEWVRRQISGNGRPVCHDSECILGIHVPSLYHTHQSYQFVHNKSKNLHLTFLTGDLEEQCSWDIPRYRGKLEGRDYSAMRQYYSGESPSTDKTEEKGLF